MDVTVIRNLTLADVPDLCRIYNHYVVHSIATFEQEPVSEEEMAHRMSIVTRHFPWLVVEGEGQVTGFAYANFWKARRAYRQTLEATIYLSHDVLGQGLGLGLYQALHEQLRERNDCHRVLACISLPNPASVALHEKLGYRRVGYFSEVGKKFGRWVDVEYWQLDL